jgi:hypothetical protein
MTDTHAVRVTGTGLPDSTGVEIDGTSVVNGLAGITIALSGDHLPKVTLRLIPAVALDLALDAVFDDDHGTAEALKRLGWTAPGSEPERSTPGRFADCDEVTDRRGKTWRYSLPADVWGLVVERDKTIARYSARSWQRLTAEFGPLTDAGSR